MSLNASPEPIATDTVPTLTGLSLEVIDYGGGNVGSALRSLQRLGVDYRLVGGENPMPTGDKPLFFPGVGAFGAAMAQLKARGLDERLQSMLKQGTPYLGICIGLQVLFEGSEEAPSQAGLGILPGQVVKFTQGKIPQIGWNHLQAQQAGWPEGHVYFVNSYYPQLRDPADCLYDAMYYQPFTAAIRQGRLIAFQFHPEKSGPFGQRLLAQALKEISQ
jgi:imidazole glycerol phosphate synthase glutamine amidotransferase subunit